MPPRKKKNPEVETLSGLDAIEAVFEEMTEVECVNLDSGNRVQNTLSTNSLMLDLMLGGGLQRGRIADIYGPEGSGKTTLAQECVVSAQRINIPQVVFDTEHACDPRYMRTQGIDFRFRIREGRKLKKGFFYSQPGPGEDIYRALKRILSRMPKIDPEKPGPPSILFVIDSFAAMFSEAEDDSKTGPGALGMDARMHSRHLRKCRSLLGSRGGLLVVTNQIRQGIDLRNPARSGETEPGGNALRFYADYKIRVSARRKVAEDKTKLARQHIYARTVKNKCFSPFQMCELDLILGRGLDKAEDVRQFLQAIGKYKTAGGRHKILLSKLAPDKALSWKEFRQLTEQPEFRARCFRLLRKDKVYAAYFKQLDYLNYSYDRAQRHADDEE